MKAPVAVAAAGILFLAGCSAPGPEDDGVDFSHVHGLAYSAESGTLRVATHHGMVNGVGRGSSWTWTFASAERFDYMGFTQDAVRPDVFYSSGHPNDPQSFGGVHLGLRRSTDAGVTWEQRSLKGQVDFHALAALPQVEGGLVGAWRDQLMESRDGGLTWANQTGPSPAMLGVAATADLVVVAGSDGLAGGRLGDPSGWQRFADPEPGRIATAIAASSDGSVMFAGTGNGQGAGATYRSTDGAMTWQKVGEPLLAEATVPAVFAFDPADAGHVFAATVAGDVLESRDAGASWDVLRRV